MAHAAHLDPIHQLQGRPVKRLVVFPPGPAAMSPYPGYVVIPGG